jgi:hypothetical protein
LPQATFKFSKTQKDKIAFFDFDSFWKDAPLKKPYYEYVPEPFRKAGYDRFFFEGQLLTRLKPLKEFVEYAEQVKARIRFTNPIISMHIRRGDKYVEAPYVPLRIYIDSVKKIRAQTGIEKVFVTSDSEEAIQSLPRDIGIEFIYDDQEPRYDNANHRFLRNNPKLASQETFTAYKIYQLLADADYIIGPDNAHLTLLGASLNSARTGNTQNKLLIPGTLKFKPDVIRYWPLIAKERLRVHALKNRHRRWSKLVRTVTH